MPSFRDVLRIIGWLEKPRGWSPNKKSKLCRYAALAMCRKMSPDFMVRRTKSLATVLMATLDSDDDPEARLLAGTVLVFWNDQRALPVLHTYYESAKGRYASRIRILTLALEGNKSARAWV